MGRDEDGLDLGWRGFLLYALSPPLFTLFTSYRVILLLPGMNVPCLVEPSLRKKKKDWLASGCSFVQCNNVGMPDVRKGRCVM